MWKRRKSCCVSWGRFERTDSCLSSHRDCHTAAEKRLPSVSTLSTGGAPVQLMPESQLSLKRGQTAWISLRSCPNHVILFRSLSQLKWNFWEKGRAQREEIFSKLKSFFSILLKNRPESFFFFLFAPKVCVGKMQNPGHPKSVCR